MMKRCALVLFSETKLALGHWSTCFTTFVAVMISRYIVHGISVISFPLLTGCFLLIFVRMHVQNNIQLIGVAQHNTFLIPTLFRKGPLGEFGLQKRKNIDIVFYLKISVSSWPMYSLFTQELDQFIIQTGKCQTKFAHQAPFWPTSPGKLYQTRNFFIISGKDIGVVFFAHVWNLHVTWILIIIIYTFVMP